MTSSFFVKPHTTPLTVPTVAGDVLLEVKQRLTTGEYQGMLEQMYGQDLTLKPLKVRQAKLLAYIVGWNVTDNGKDVPFTEAHIANLDFDVFAAIGEAIDTHIDTIDAEREVQKNALAGVSASPATSLSPA